ncbi:MAG: hypothetical protein LBB43_02010 [Spirochaetaceae bacterium]|nr:hypothetical protein [Spirochaetaceae bacterium]
MEAVSGNPRNEYDIVIEILSSRTLNEGTFRMVVDGLASKRFTIPDEPGTYEIPGTGITLTFAGTFAEGGYLLFIYLL